MLSNPSSSTIHVDATTVEARKAYQSEKLFLAILCTINPTKSSAKLRALYKNPPPPTRAMFPFGQRWQHEREREGLREGHRGSRTPRTPRSPLEAVREEVDMLPAISITYVPPQ